MSQGFFSFGETKRTMIQNELLPGCAFRHGTDKFGFTEHIWEESTMFRSDINPAYFDPIPLTTDTVSRVEGFEVIDFTETLDEGEVDLMTTFMRGCGNGYDLWVAFNEDNSLYGTDINGNSIMNHITTVHQLQILIYSLTGTMPKYDVR